LLGRSAAEQRRAYEALQATPSGRRTLTSITGEFPELPAGARPGFRDFRTQRLLEKGRSLEPRSVSEVAQSATQFAARRPVIAGLGALVGGGLAVPPILSAISGAREPEASQADVLSILKESGVGKSTEDYLRGLAKEQIAALGTDTGFTPEIQSQLDARQASYENALIDANRRYLEAIGGGEVPAAAMGAYSAGAQEAQAAAEADTGTAVSSLTPVSGDLASAPEMMRAEGSRQAALQQILASTAAGSSQRAQDLAALAGAESVGNLRSDYESALLAQRIQDARAQRQAEREINADLFSGISRLGLERVRAGEQVSPQDYVAKINEYVAEYAALNATQKAALAQTSNIGSAEEYATARLRQEYGV
jgi:hypothetical protein